MPLPECPARAGAEFALGLLGVLENQFRVLDRLLLGSSQLFERRYESVSRVERLEAHTVRITAGHEIHRLQNLKRSYLTHRHPSIEMHRALGRVASYAPDEVRPRVHQSPQKIVEPRVEVLSQRRDRLITVQAKK